MREEEEIQKDENIIGKDEIVYRNRKRKQKEDEKKVHNKQKEGEMLKGEKTARKYEIG